MFDFKERFIELLESLDMRQIEYLYHLACKLFGHTVD